MTDTRYDELMERAGRGQLSQADLTELSEAAYATGEVPEPQLLMSRERAGGLLKPHA